MPFASDKQRRYLFLKKPEVAKKFAADSKPSQPVKYPKLTASLAPKAPTVNEMIEDGSKKKDKLY